MPRYDFSGSCPPGTYGSQQTFSVGIYPVVQKASGKGQKKGAVEVRVRGSVADEQEIYKEARKICKLLEYKIYCGPKTVTVRNRKK